MKNKLLIVGAIVLSFVCGTSVAYKTMNNDTISINGNRVKIVDVMYTYKTEEGEVIEGDYSLVSQKGYEYNPIGGYNKEYENAKLRK